MYNETSFGYQPKKPVEFPTLEDWKAKFKACQSEQTRVGMLHALIKVEAFGKHAEESLRQSPILIVSHTLHWAADQTSGTLCKTIALMILTHCYRTLPKQIDERVLQTLNLLQNLHRSLDRTRDADKPLVREITTFLERAAGSYCPLDQNVFKERRELVRTACLYGQFDAFLRIGWIGRTEVVEQLKELLGGSAISDAISRGDIAARHLAIHLASYGLFDSQADHVGWCHTCGSINKQKS
jgi:hypothetical protein